NYLTSTSPGSPFVRQVVAGRKGDHDLRQLINREYFVTSADGATTTRVVTDEELGTKRAGLGLTLFAAESAELSTHLPVVASWPLAISYPWLAGVDGRKGRRSRVPCTDPARCDHWQRPFGTDRARGRRLAAAGPEGTPGLPARRDRPGGAGPACRPRWQRRHRRLHRPDRGGGGVPGGDAGVQPRLPRAAEDRDRQRQGGVVRQAGRPALLWRECRRGPGRGTATAGLRGAAHRHRPGLGEPAARVRPHRRDRWVPPAAERRGGR